MSINVDVLTGRKIVASAVTLALGGVAVALKGDIPDNFLTLLMTVLGAFVAGNSVEHIAAMLQKRVTGASNGDNQEIHTSVSPAETLPSTELVNAMVEMNMKLDRVMDSCFTTQTALSAIIKNYKVKLD